MKRILLLFGILSCWTSNAQLVAPTTESFDGTTTPTGWTQSATTGGPWRFTGSTNSVNCSPAPDHTGNLGNYAWMDQSGGDAGVILEMDTVDVSALTTPYLEFYYWMCGVGYTPPNITHVEAYDGTSTWQNVATINTATNGWQREGYDLTNFTYGNNRVLIRFRAESGGSGSDFFGDNAIDDVTVEEAPTCIPPSGLSLTNITATTMDLSWNLVTGATNYTIIWDTLGFDPATSGNSATSATSPYTITGLTGNTLYDVYIIADCGVSNGLSDTVGPITDRTACVAEAIGYTNGFEADASNTTPLCWANYVTSGNSNTNVITFSFPNTGARHVQLSSGFATANDTIMLFTPQLLGLTSGNNQIRFFSQADQTVVEMIVGTVSNPTNPSSFTPIDTIRYNSTFTYEEHIVAITTANGYNGTDEYIAFMHNNAQTFTEAFIDDFVYEAIPPCPKLTGIQVVSVGTNSATFSFNTSGTTVGYEWGPVGFSQGTGTTDTIPGNPITITGLSPQTTYDIYLRNDCQNAGNGTSIWSGPITFTTLCAIQSTPYVQDFENATVGHWDGIEDCWAYESNNPGTSSSGGYSWEVRNTSQTTSGTGTGPDRDNTLAPAIGGNFITADVSGSSTFPSPDSTMVTGPLVDVSSLTVPELSFYYHKHGSNMPDLNVDIWDGTWHRNALVITGVTQTSQSDPYLKGTLDLSSYNDTIQVRFRILTLGCCQGDIGLDDIRVDEAPTCDVPSLIGLVNRTSSSGTINWVPGGSQVGTIIEYGVSGFAPGTGMTIVTTDTIDTIPGLLSNTTYDVYLIDSCGINGNSLQVGPFSFTTRCNVNPTNLPLIDGFESYATGPYQAPTDFCNPTWVWEYEPTVSQGRLRTAAGTGFSNNGTQAMTMDNASFVSPATTNFLTLNVNLSNYTTTPGIELSFDVLAISQEANPDNRVWVRGSYSDPWIEIVNLDNVTTNGQFVSVDNIDIIGPLSNNGQSVGSETQIRFGQAGTSSAFSTAFSDGYSFDDVELRQVTCPTPSGLVTGNVVDTASTLQWNGSSFASDYEVWFGPQGFFQGSQTTGGIKVLTGGVDSLHIDTISSITCYEFLVRYICGAGDTSLWAGPYQWCTPCSPFFAPYTENYDAMVANQAPTCWTGLLEGPGTPFAGVTVIGFNSLSPFNTMELDNWTGNNTVIAYSPLFGDLDVGDKRVTFWARQNFGAGAQLIVGTNDNPNTSTGFTGIDTITLDATYTEYTVDLTTANGYNGTDKYVGLMHGQQANFQPLYVDDFVYEVIPTCPKPNSQSLFAQVVGATDAEMEWDPGTAGNTNFQISFGIGITDPNQGIQSVVTGDSALLTGLTSNTGYCFYVREICGPGDTSVWNANPICFTTLCLPFTAPYVQDFETSTVGHWDGLEDCWDFSSNNPGTTSSGGYSWEIRNTSQITSGTGTGPDRDNTLAPNIGGNFVTADVSGSTFNGFDSTMIVSPLIDISGLTNPELQYFYHMHGTNMADLHVDFWNGQSWDRDIHVITGTQNTSQSDPYNDTIEPLTAYAGQTDFRVRFRGISNNCCSGDIAIDDIRISDPISCIKPENLGATGISGVGMTLVWDPAAGQSGANYQVSHGLNLNDPLLGTQVVTTADSLVLTGLMASSTYCFYVREICSAGDTSLWAGPFCENTLCLPFTAPYFQDFESTSLGHWDGEDDCWDFSSNNAGPTSSGGYSWEVRNTSQTTSGTGTGPDRDNTLAPAIGGQFITADVSGSSTLGPDSTLLTSPIIDISGLTNPELEYYYHMHGTNMADLHVDIWNGSSWDRDVHLITGTQNISQSDPYNDTIFSLSAYVGQTDLRVRFRGVTNGCCSGDIALDDIRISDPPSCPKPINQGVNGVTASDATLTWDPALSSTGTNFHVSYGINIPDPQSGTQVVTNTDSLVLSGLTDNSVYCYYVREICAPGDSSFWVGPVCFRTDCLPVTAPYLQDFENSTVGHWDGENDCWDYFSNNPGTTSSGGYSWEVRNTAQTTSGTSTGPDRDNTLAPNIGGNFITADVSGSSTIGPDSTVITSPSIDISTLSSPALEYYYHMHGTNMADLHVDIWNGTSWDNDVNLITGTQNISQSDPYNDTLVSLLAYAGQTDLKIRFRAVTNGCCSGDIALDDIRVFDSIIGPGTCLMPNSLDSSNVGCISADLSWNSSKAGASSILIWGPAGFDPNVTGTNVGLVQSPYNLSSLTPGTSYDFYVADTCTNDTSDWAGPLNFVTATGPITADFTPTLGAPTLTDLTVTVDASASVGANTYTWRWGDGTPDGSGMNTTHDYTANGGYNITLIVTGDCGTDSITKNVIVAGIDLAENSLGRSMELYPNPTNGIVNLSFRATNSNSAVISVMDLTGKTISRIEVSTPDGKYEGEVDIRDYSKGTYILKVESGDMSVKRRIVKY